MSSLVNAQLESLYICISLDYLMTLQDFFVSGLPSGNNETKPKIDGQPTTTTELTESSRSQGKVDKKPSTTPPKLPAIPPKGIENFSKNFFLQ